MRRLTNRFAIVLSLLLVCLGALLMRGSPPPTRAQSPPTSLPPGPSADARGPRCPQPEARPEAVKARMRPALRERLQLCRRWRQRLPESPADPFRSVSPNIPSDKARLSALRPARATARQSVIVQLDGPPVAEFRLRRFLPAGRRPQPLSPEQQESLRRYAEELTQAQDRVIATLRRQGIDLKVKSRYRYVFNGMAVEVPTADVERLNEVPGIKAVFPDRLVWATLNDSVPLIGAPTVWAMHDSLGRPVQGQDIVVAIIDTGIDYTHPDLGGCTAVGPGCRVADGYDFVNDDNDPFDDNGHGTHVAGIVGANGTVKGVAPQVTFYAYKVLNQYGSGSDSQVIAGIERAVDPDQDPGTNDAVDVMNLSLGGMGGRNDPVTVAVENAVRAGVVAAVAAGNAGRAGFFTVGSPGNAEHAITVGATDKSDVLADFSSRGPIPQGWLLKPDITAPGVAISSTVPSNSYAVYDGTSMATPHVAGAAALLRQLHPDWTPEEVKAALVNGALDVGYSPIEQGTGRLDLPMAADPLTLVTPTSLGLGVDYYQDQPIWSATATFTITNRSPVTVTYAITAPTGLPAGVNVGLSAVSVTVGISASVGVTLTVDVDNATVTPPGPPTYTISDTLTIGASGQPEIRLPFGFGMFTGVDAYEDDNSPATANPIPTDGTPQTHNFHVSNDEDWVKFQATAGTNYVIETRQIYDYKQWAVLELYDTDGTTLLADNDRVLWWYQSRIEWTAPANGTYYVRVLPGWGETFFGDITQYDLAVYVGGEGSIGPDAYEGDNTPVDAVLIQPNGVVHHHNFYGDGDEDWVKFQAQAGQSYIIETLNLRFMADTILELYDTDGTTLLVRDDNSSGSDTWGSFIQWTAPADGIYYVRVRNWVNETFGTQYDLVIRPQGMDLAGQIGGGMSAVDVIGNHAIVGHGPRVEVVDVSDPANPQPLGQTEPLADVVNRLNVVDNVAYVADGPGGFYTVSIANPAHPQVLDHYDAWAFDVVITGTVAYVAGGWQVVAFSVADPANVTLLGSLDTSNGWVDAVAVSGDHLYAADSWNGLRVINVADPANPVQEVVVPHHGGYPTDVAVADGYAYVTSEPRWDGSGWSGGGIQAIQVITPTESVEVGYLDSAGVSVDAIDVVGNVAHLARGESGLQVVSIADPTNMVVRSQIDTRDWAIDVKVAGGTGYVADYNGGLRIIDVSNPDSPAEQGAYEPPGAPWAIALNGTLAVTVEGVALRTFDITDPFAPVARGVLDLDAAPLNGWGTDVALAGSTAYVAGGDAGLVEVDLSDPTNPTVSGQLDLGGFAQVLSLRDGRAFVGVGSTLHVISVVTPGNPTPQGTLTLPDYIWDLTATDSLVLVADNNAGLRIVSVMDPANPVEMANRSFNGAVTGVAVQGSTAYVTEYPWWIGYRYAGGGLWAVSIANPANPYLVGYYDTTGWPRRVTRIGNVAYLSDSGMLRGITVGEPWNMHGVQFREIPGWVAEATDASEYLAVAGGAGGLWMVSRHPCAGNPGDLNCDGVTDVNDLALATPYWRHLVIGAPFDRDFNLWVNIVDFVSLVRYWGP